MSYLSALDLDEISHSTRAAVAVARWWAAVLRSPRQETGADEVDTVLLIQHLCFPDENNRISEDFTRVLAQLIEGEGVHRLDVEYRPHPLLEEAVEASDSRIAKWPWKSHTRTDFTGAVLAKCGQGQPEEVIWRPST